MPKRHSDASHATTFPKRGFFVLQDPAAGATEKFDAGVLHDLRNALASRGGLAFDGTNAHVSGAMQVIGTDAFSDVFVLQVPASVTDAVGHTFGGMSDSAGNLDRPSAISYSLELSGGTLQAQLRNAANTGGMTLKFVGFVSAYAGKTVILKFVRPASGTAQWWVNGAQLAATSATYGSSPGDWQNTVNSTQQVIGRLSSGVLPFTSRVYSRSLYNLALSQADITEIYELGGAVPERFKFGSRDSVPNGAATKLGAADGTTLTPGDGAGGGGVSQTAIAGARTAGVGSYYEQFAANGVSSFVTTTGWFAGFSGGNEHGQLAYPVRGQVQAVRVRGWSRKGAGGTFVVMLAGNVLPVDAAWTAFDFTATISINYRGVPSLMLAFSGGSQIAGDAIHLDDVQVTPLGAIAHYDADADGIGYQLHDQLIHKLDAAITATGARWTKPARRGYVRGTLTWAGTHEPKSLLGNIRDLPNEAVVTLITTKATAATSGSGVSIGSVNTIARYVAANAITTAKKAHTLANAMPSSSVDGDCTLALDPDTANYTGSITAEVHYSVTEGAP